MKTDSGSHGPIVGTPVLLQAGRLGDCAFLILFSGPEGIGQFIEKTC
jgi:hypothetical protein